MALSRGCERSGVAREVSDRVSVRAGNRRLVKDARGVVYVEFLFAFFPVFFLFLGTCQLALLAMAHVFVRHAAFSAVRSAVVVLSDDPKDYDGAPRDSLSNGSASARERLQALLTGLARIAGLPPPVIAERPPRTRGAQQGARMAPIRAAAYMALLPLAPRAADGSTPVPQSLERALLPELEERLAFAVDYTEAASVVTAQAAEGDDQLSPDPIDPKAAVTIRVTYLYRCSVPFVRTLLCSALDAVLDPNERADKEEARLRQWFELGDAPGALGAYVQKGARFRVIQAEASLPNQGAGYETQTDSKNADDSDNAAPAMSESDG